MALPHTDVCDLTTTWLPQTAAVLRTPSQLVQSPRPPLAEFFLQGSDSQPVGCDHWKTQISMSHFMTRAAVTK